MESFENDPRPNKETFKNLSQQLGLSETTVYNWFRRVRKISRKTKHLQLPKGKFICVCRDKTECNNLKWPYHKNPNCELFWN